MKKISAILAERQLIYTAFRLRTPIVQGLFDASADRKRGKQPNATKRAIVEEALTDWLSKHGYIRNGRKS